MTRITGIQAREILDSRGNPTVEVDVILENDAGFRSLICRYTSHSGDNIILQLQQQVFQLPTFGIIGT